MFFVVVKMATIKIIIIVASSKGWNLFQLDVNNAFLREELDDKVHT